MERNYDSSQTFTKSPTLLDSTLRSPVVNNETNEAIALTRRKNAAIANETDKALLRLLLIKQDVVQKWPAEWKCEERPEKAERLRLLHQGRFLDDDITLKGLNLPKEQFTTMHLLLRPKQADMELMKNTSKRSPKSAMSNQNGSCCACLQM